MNYKQMLDKFQELDARLKVLEEDYWLNKLNKLPKPKFAPGTLPEVNWPENYWVTTKDNTT